MHEEHFLGVQVSQLIVSNVGFILLLKGDEDPRSLPIFIGAAEAQSIALQLNSVTPPRPLTHDLLKNILDLLECRLMRVEVARLEAGTYYARLVVERDGIEVDIDSRPSDAIAIALRSSAPIYVAQDVMEEAGRIIRPETDEHEHEEPAPDAHEEAGGGEGGTGSPPRRPGAGRSPVEVLKAKLQRAVKAERYEEAARFRDEIARLEHTHTDN